MYKDINQTVWTEVTKEDDPFFVKMPTSKLLGDNVYILRISTNKSSLGNKCVIFRTRPHTHEEKPELIVPNDSRVINVEKNIIELVGEEPPAPTALE